MCLRVNNDAEKQIASEDIVCYKRVFPSFSLYIGKSFTGIIQGIKCEGKIQIEDNQIFFCTNDFRLDGIDCYDKIGYKYSWVLDSYVKSIIIDEIDIMISTNQRILLTPYQYATVQIGETYTSDLLRCGFKVNVGLHSYTTYKDAKNDGHGVVVKCIIPKGAEYYEGTFAGVGSCASNQLKYLEIVEK